MKINNAYVYRKVFDARLLIPVTNSAKTRNMVSLNMTAGMILDYCGDCDTPEDLADLILANEKFSGDLDEARNQLIAFARRLLENEILLREGVVMP